MFLSYAGFVGFGVSATGFTVAGGGGLWYVGRLAGPCVILIFFLLLSASVLASFYIYIWLLHSWVDRLKEKVGNLDLYGEEIVFTRGFIDFLEHTHGFGGCIVVVE